MKLAVLGSDGVGSPRKVWEVQWLAVTLWGWERARKRGWGKGCVSPPAFESFSTAPPSSSAPQSTVQSYLEGVSAGLEQLRSAAQEVQSVCQELGAARWALLDSADRFQGLQQMRALMAEHVQLASVVQVLPQLFSGKALAWASCIWAGRRWENDSPTLGSAQGWRQSQSRSLRLCHLGLGSLLSWRCQGLTQDGVPRDLRAFPSPIPCYPAPVSLVPMPSAPSTQSWHLPSLSYSPRSFFPYPAAAPWAATPGSPRGAHDDGAPPG